jgi:hypothetical protein
MARNCSTPPVKGIGKGQGDGGKGGKSYGKEERVCYNCGKKGHLSKDCWSVKGKGKGKGKEVNGLGDAKADNSWMVAGVFANPDLDSAQLGPIATSNYWDELSWSEEEEEEEEQPPEMLFAAEEEEQCSPSYPPGLLSLQSYLEEDEGQPSPSTDGPSMFDQLFPQKVSQVTQVKEEEFEIVEDDEEKQLEEEEIDEAVIEYPSVNGGIFDWDDLQDQVNIDAVFEINGVDKTSTKVKIAIDSAAADSVCPADWAEQFPIVKVPVREFVTATGADIKHSGQKTVALGAAVNGKEKTIGMVFQACDVKRPLAAVNKICAKGNIVQFGPGVNDNFIQNISTKEKIWLTQERGQYVMEASLRSSSPF